jgi:hypothetical protein
MGMAGCDDSTPPTGSRAIVPASYLEKQRDKIEQIKASLRARSVSKPANRR